MTASEYIVDGQVITYSGGRQHTDTISWRDATKLELEQQREIELIGKHRDILAMHMAEVNAIADGVTKNSLREVVEHCLKEINELGL